MFAALLALGDICPPEWPAAGASQNIAAAAAAEGKSKSGEQRDTSCAAGLKDCLTVFRLDGQGMLPAQLQ